METVTYRLFGIPIWSITRSRKIDDALYEEMRDRFAKDMNEILTRRGQR